MISCKICGTKVYSSDIAKKGICLICMEDYEEIHKVLNGTPKNIDNLSVIITAHPRKLCVEILLYEGLEGEVYTNIKIDMWYLSRSVSPHLIKNEVYTHLNDLGNPTGYDIDDVTHKVLDTWVRNKDLAHYLHKPKPKVAKVMEIAVVEKKVRVNDKAEVKLPKAIVVSKGKLEVLLSNLLDKYCK